MAKKLWVLFAAIFLLGSIGCAGKGAVSGPPSPLIKDPTTGMELVYIKGGCYQMGNIFGDGGPEEKPVHEACVDDFYIGKYEVTQGQWIKIMGRNPSNNTSCGDDCPVETVSWDDAQEFIAKLNRKSRGSKYRLPTEAEWEYAARSWGEDEKYSGGNRDEDAVLLAWWSVNSQYTVHPVGTKAPNGPGLYDMSGNVWEWTNDWYADDYYSSSPRNNPTGPDSGTNRVLRGGSWKVGEFDIRTFYRNYLPPDYSNDSIGFRIVKIR